MIAITGATGQLGRLVIETLLSRVPAAGIVALVRDPSKAADLAARGVAVRAADYRDPASLRAALTGVSQLLLISGNEIGQRLPQHRNVIEAALAAKVGRLLYTSLLRADTSTLSLADEHLATEKLIAASGIPHVILRHGWYTENYTVSIKPALGLGAFYGSAGSGRVSSATRRDFAEADVAALLDKTLVNVTLELAGDQAYTLAELAAEVSRQTGKPLPYVDIPEAAYRDALLKAGLPEGLATLLAHSDTEVAKGSLYAEGKQLSRLLGRPTTPLSKAVADALAA